MEAKLMIVVNFFLCVMGGWMVICRARHMKPGFTKPVIRVGYLIEFALLIASAISWTYSGPVTLIQFLLTAGIVFRLYIGVGAWKEGQPKHATLPAAVVQQ